MSRVPWAEFDRIWRARANGLITEQEYREAMFLVRVAIFYGRPA